MLPNHEASGTCGFCLPFEELVFSEFGTSLIFFWSTQPATLELGSGSKG